MSNSTPTQDQLKAEFLSRYSFHDSECPVGLTGGGKCRCQLQEIWEWITSVYEPKVREEMLSQIKYRLETYVWDSDLGEDHLNEVMNNRRELNKFVLSQLLTPDKDHE